MLIVSAEESDLYFHELDGHLGEVTTGEEGIGNRGPVSDSSLGLGPVMTAKEAVESVFSGFETGQGAQNDQRAATGCGGREERPTTGRPPVTLDGLSKLRC